MKPPRTAVAQGSWPGRTRPTSPNSSVRSPRADARSAFLRRTSASGSFWMRNRRRNRAPCCSPCAGCFVCRPPDPGPNISPIRGCGHGSVKYWGWPAGASRHCLPRVAAGAGLHEVVTRCRSRRTCCAGDANWRRADAIGTDQADAIGVEIAQNPPGSDFVPVPSRRFPGLTDIVKRRLRSLVEALGPAPFAGRRVGLEKESLRVDRAGYISQRPHPEALGSALAQFHHHYRFLGGAPRVRDSRVPGRTRDRPQPAPPAPVHVPADRGRGAVGDQHALHGHRRSLHPHRGLRQLQRGHHEARVPARAEPSLRPGDADYFGSALQLLPAAAVLDRIPGDGGPQRGTARRFLVRSILRPGAQLPPPRMAGAAAVRVFPGDLPIVPRQRAARVPRVEPGYALRAVRHLAADERHRLQEQVAETARNLLRHSRRLRPARCTKRRTPCTRPTRTSESSTASTASSMRTCSRSRTSTTASYAPSRSRTRGRSRRSHCSAGACGTWKSGRSTSTRSRPSGSMRTRCGSWRRS